MHGWWYTVQKTSSQKHQPTGKKWRLRFLNLNNHVKQISSFHLQSHFCGHEQLKDWQPHFQPTLVKCSISRIIQCFFSGHIEPSEMGIFLNKSWTPQLREQTPCFSASDGFFSAAATKGWAWSSIAELVERAAVLRHLKLLVGSGDLDFTKGIDSLDKHVWKISFRQCVTLCEHGQQKGWRKATLPTRCC